MKKKGKIHQTANGRYRIDVVVLGKRYRKTFDSPEAALDCLNAIRCIRDRDMKEFVIDNVIDRLRKRKNEPTE